MADPRGWYVLINELERRPWMDTAAKPSFSSVDAEPLPPEPERGVSIMARRVLVRLLAVVRPGRTVPGALR